MPTLLPQAELEAIAERLKEEAKGEVREHPEWEDRLIVNKLGCGHPLVAGIRQELQATGIIFQLDQQLGEDGPGRMKGSRTLGELEGTVHLLEVRCTKCDGHGRERIARLIDRYGRSARLPDVRHHLSGDCPHRSAALYERCDVYFPQLAAG